MLCDMYVYSLRFSIFHTEHFINTNVLINFFQIFLFETQCMKYYYVFPIIKYLITNNGVNIKLIILYKCKCSD